MSNKYDEKEIDNLLAIRTEGSCDGFLAACDQLAAAREIIRQVRAVLLYVNQWPGVGQCDLVEKALRLTEESSDE